MRTLAHAARLIRNARELEKYGIVVGEPSLDFPRLLTRVREVVCDVQSNSTFRSQIDSLGVTVHETPGMLDSSIRTLSKPPADYACVQPKR